MKVPQIFVAVSSIAMLASCSHGAETPSEISARIVRETHWHPGTMQDPDPEQDGHCQSDIFKGRPTSEDVLSVPLLGMYSDGRVKSLRAGDNPGDLDHHKRISDALMVDSSNINLFVHNVDRSVDFGVGIPPTRVLEAIVSEMGEPYYAHVEDMSAPSSSLSPAIGFPISSCHASSLVLLYGRSPRPNFRPGPRFFSKLISYFKTPSSDDYKRMYGVCRFGNDFIYIDVNGGGISVSNPGTCKAPK